MRTQSNALAMPAPGWSSQSGRLEYLTRKWNGPERTMVLVLAIVVVTILGAIAMLPNTEEKAQVLLSMGRTGDAISLYETKSKATRLNPFETYSLAGLYQTEGKIAPLTRLLEAEIVMRPESGWAREDLAAIYRSNRAYADEARILAQTFMLDPTPIEFRRLIVLYRLLGDQRGELATLETARTADLANAADLARLDHLLNQPSPAESIATWQASDYAAPETAPLSETIQ